MARDVRSHVSLSSTERAELSTYVRSGPGWYLLSQESVPAVFRGSFRSKTDSALMIVAGDSSATTFLVCNALRVDGKASKIDQEPFAIAVTHGEVPVSGLFVHHGSWKSRSFDPGEGFWSAVSASGVGNYFLANPPSGLTQGTLEQLPLGSRGAFEAAVQAIRSGGA